MRLGFIGLGKMGKPMVERLLIAGHEVHVFNRSSASIEYLVQKGAYPASSASAVAERADMIMTALPDPENVDIVFDQLVGAARTEQIFADHSTVSPRQNKRIAARLAEKGAEYLDAPVSGGPSGASSGTLTVMVGGEKATFRRAEPVF